MQGQQALTMLFLRAWMWLVPIALVVAGVLFAVLAAADGRWGLFVVMVFMALVGVSLGGLHWWLLYRFGKTSGGKP
jgi:hypothetical protein